MGDCEGYEGDYEVNNEVDDYEGNNEGDNEVEVEAGMDFILNSAEMNQIRSEDLNEQGESSNAAVSWIISLIDHWVDIDG